MRWMPVMLTAVTLAVPCTGDAQRRPPEIVDFGVPSTGEVHRGRLVQWDYWGLTVESCTRAGDLVTCRLNVANGSGEAHTLCLGAAALVSERHPAGSPMTLVADPQHRTGPAGCRAIAAHEGLLLEYRGRVPSGTVGTALRIAITERLPRGASKPDSTLTASAVVPVATPTRRP